MPVNNRIKFSDESILDCAEAEGIPCVSMVYDMIGEQYIKIHFQAAAEEVKSKFQDGITCAHLWDEEILTPVLNEDGTSVIDENFLPRMTTTFLTHSEKLVENAVTGDIIISKDGTTYVMVRNPNELELTQAALDGAMLRILTGGN